MNEFVIYNGEVYTADKVPLTFNNRAFKYGDSFFESIKCNGHYPLHFHLHYKRMVKAMISLKMDIAMLPSEAQWEAFIVQLLRKKKSYGASRVRMQVFRSGEGLYTPTSSEICYIIESTALNTVPYALNTKGLLVDVFDEMKKQYNPLSAFKNGNSLHYVLAACFKNESGVDDVLLINDKNKIIEANSSNLFWIKDGIAYTPSIFSGCIDGVMRALVINSLEKSGLLRLIETQGATKQELLHADEIFITNAIQGIQWIVGFKEKRYFCQITKKIVDLVNKETFGV